MGKSLTADAHFSAFFNCTRFFENNVLFDNSTPIYLSALEIRVRIRVRLVYSCTILAFFTENDEND